MTQGFTCELRDRYPVERVIKRQSSVVIWAQRASTTKAFKNQNQAQQGTLDFQTLITHSTATYTRGIPNSREATQVGLEEIQRLRDWYSS